LIEVLSAPSVRRPRDNPFRTSRIEALPYRLSKPGRFELLEKWRDLGRQGALVGRKGSGKTTLLRELEQHLERPGHRLCRIRLTEVKPRPSTAEWQALTRRLESSAIVTIDGAEQLSRWLWWRIRRLALSSGGLLITCHSPGRLPTLYDHKTDPQLLADLVEELVDERLFTQLLPKLDRLFVRHDGNIRECLRALYDHWAGDSFEAL